MRTLSDVLRMLPEYRSALEPLHGSLPPQPSPLLPFVSGPLKRAPYDHQPMAAWPLHAGTLHLSEGAGERRTLHRGNNHPSKLWVREGPRPGQSGSTCPATPWSQNGGSISKGSQSEDSRSLKPRFPQTQEVRLPRKGPRPTENHLLACTAPAPVQNCSSTRRGGLPGY